MSRIQEKIIWLNNGYYTDKIELLSVAVPVYDWEDNGIFYVSTGGDYLKQTHKPVAIRHFILVNGEIVTDGLTDYGLAKEINYLIEKDDFGGDYIMYLTGKPGTWDKVNYPCGQGGK